MDNDTNGSRKPSDEIWIQWVICIAAILLPLPGIIFGICAVTRKERDWYHVGKCAILVSIVGLAIQAVVGFFYIAAYIATLNTAAKAFGSVGNSFGKSVEQIVTAANESSKRSAHVDIISWSQCSPGYEAEVHILPPPGERLLEVKVRVKSTGCAAVALDAKRFALTCKDRTIISATGYGHAPLPSSLDPGAYATGSLLFVVRKSSAPMFIDYEKGWEASGDLAPGSAHTLRP